MSATGLSNGTVMRLEASMNDPQNLDRLLNPSEYRAGAQTILTPSQENAICERLKSVALRGFAVDVQTLKSIMVAVAKDNGRSFRNDLPSDDLIRSFRARHRDIIFRNFENRELCKLQGEHPEHIRTYEVALESVAKQNPGSFSTADKLWNLDETNVLTEHGERKKVFGPSNTHHGGFRTKATYSAGKHVTAIIVASASGHVLPPFFVFAGVNQMSRWFDPLPSEVFKDESGAPHWVTVEGWLPSDSFIVGTGNGSMEMRLLPMLLKHIDAHARKIVPGSEKICLTLNGHSSRNGYDWLDLCVEHNIEVVQSPANASQFLQPCDSHINKTFKRTIRKMIDYLSEFSLLNTADIGMKLKLGVTAHRSLTAKVVNDSFNECSMWPMDYRFVKESHERQKTIQSANILRGVTAKRQELNTFRKIRQVLQEKPTPGVVIASIVMMLKDHERIENILNKYTTDKKEYIGNRKRVAGHKPREVFFTGTPALYLMHS